MKNELRIQVSEETDVPDAVLTESVARWEYEGGSLAAMPPRSDHPPEEQPE